MTALALVPPPIDRTRPTIRPIDDRRYQITYLGRTGTLEKVGKVEQIDDPHGGFRRGHSTTWSSVAIILTIDDLATGRPSEIGRIGFNSDRTEPQQSSTLEVATRRASEHEPEAVARFVEIVDSLADLQVALDAHLRDHKLTRAQEKALGPIYAAIQAGTAIEGSGTHCAIVPGCFAWVRGHSRVPTTTPGVRWAYDRERRGRAYRVGDHAGYHGYNLTYTAEIEKITNGWVWFRPYGNKAKRLNASSFATWNSSDMATIAKANSEWSD